MELKEAIEDTKEFIEYAQNMINDMEYERPVDVTVYQHNLNAIDTVLEELNNRIPISEIEKILEAVKRQREKEINELGMSLRGSAVDILEDILKNYKE